MNQNCFRFFNWFRKKNWKSWQLPWKVLPPNGTPGRRLPIVIVSWSILHSKNDPLNQSTRDTGSYCHPSWISSLTANKFFWDRRWSAHEHIYLSRTLFFQQLFHRPVVHSICDSNSEGEKSAGSSGWKKTTQRSNSAWDIAIFAAFATCRIFWIGSGVTRRCKIFFPPCFVLPTGLWDDIPCHDCG